MKYLEKIQGLLPLGYLYLIILGLLKESKSFDHYVDGCSCSFIFKHNVSDLQKGLQCFNSSSDRIASYSDHEYQQLE